MFDESVTKNRGRHHAASWRACTSARAQVPGFHTSADVAAADEPANRPPVAIEPHRP
jgi:hypothetical protein